MHYRATTNISSFFLAGINYKKSDASIRGQFAINPGQYEQLIDCAASFGIKEVFVLSTCNRTEIYGFADEPGTLSALLCGQTEGTLEAFLEIAYIKSGEQAIEHLFNVAAGLDSQILGDYEIIGQIKQSAKFSKQRGFLGVYLERMINEVLTASKKIRTNTLLSGGTVSVSFAAVQYIKHYFHESNKGKVLLIGTGKIGTNTSKNLADYLPGAAVTVINRTSERAIEIATNYRFNFDRIENMQKCIQEADVVLVATNANEPIINACDFTKGTKKLVIDLSVPCNVAEDVRSLDAIELINVDELSRIKDETLLRRSAEIPKVKAIIAWHVAEFMAWHEMRRHVPLLKDVKNKLLTIHTESLFEPTFSIPVSQCDSRRTEEKIQKVINGMALKMKAHHQPGCHYIEAINDFISTALQ